MRFDGDDVPQYPGGDVPALKVHFEALNHCAAKLGMTVTHQSGGSNFNPRTNVINIDTKTLTAKGFVSVGHLTDEYLHAWNQCHGRGTFLAGEAALEHVRLGRLAESGGTRALGTHPNVAFHKLEALNFFSSNHAIPAFVWAVPAADVRQFGSSWREQYS